MAACLVLVTFPCHETPEVQAVLAHRLVHVVDDATGQPIVGATVLAIDEAHAPVWGKTWFTAAALTDAEGDAQLPPATEGRESHWLMTRADGYGARGVMAGRETGAVEFRLRRETPITIEVVDFLGRRLPLAHLGVAFGCGHTPDLVSAVTGPDGRAVLHGVAEYDDGIQDLYVVHPELSQLNYEGVPFRDVVDGVARYHGDPGHVLTGRILLPSGQPAVGYGIGNNETHRGHWALSDARGEFRLYGAEAHENYLCVVPPGSGSDETIFFEGARSGVYRTLRLDGTPLPEEVRTGDDGAKLPTTAVKLQVQVPNPEGLDVPERLRWIPVAVWERSTGMAFSGETDATGAIQFEELPPGRYAVEVGGAASPYRARELGDIDIGPGTSGAARDLTCNLEAPQVCALTVSGLRAEETVSITTAGGAYLYHDIGGPEAKVPTFLVPSGLWGAHLTREQPDGTSQRIQLDVPRTIGDSLSLSVPR